MARYTVVWTVEVVVLWVLGRFWSCPGSFCVYVWRKGNILYHGMDPLWYFSL